MLTSRERWLAGLLAYQRQVRKDTDYPYEKKMDNSWRIADAVEQTYQERCTQVKIPTLAQVIEKNGPFAPEHVILGVDNQQNPFIIDLKDPGLGSILIMGDPGCGKTRLIRSILYSCSSVNHDNEVIFNVIASNPQEYASLDMALNCYGILKPQTGETNQLVHLLLELAEQNQLDNTPDSIIVLAIDDLVNFVYGLDEDTFRAFRWLVNHGPEYQIWVICVLSFDSMKWLDGEFLQEFPFKLFGAIQWKDQASDYLNCDVFNLPEVIPGYQFNFFFDNQWTTMWVCNPF
jgi:hypothetical protein